MADFLSRGQEHLVTVRPPPSAMQSVSSTEAQPASLRDAMQPSRASVLIPSPVKRDSKIPQPLSRVYRMRNPSNGSSSPSVSLRSIGVLTTIGLNNNVSGGGTRASSSTAMRYPSGTPTSSPRGGRLPRSITVPAQQRISTTKESASGTKAPRGRLNRSSTDKGLALVVETDRASARGKENATPARAAKLNMLSEAAQHSPTSIQCRRVEGLPESRMTLCGQDEQPLLPRTTVIKAVIPRRDINESAARTGAKRLSWNYSSSQSLAVLPSQVLVHTPARVGDSASPHQGRRVTCNSVWTMIDEMKLIRSGGMLADSQTLAPSDDVRVVPLCKRQRNGFSQDVQSDDENAFSGLRTPVRSMSSPAFLSPLPSTEIFQDDTADGEHDLQNVSELGNATRYRWTVVSVRRKNDGAAASPKPAQRMGTKFLTRAQTLVRLIGPSSRKLVNRLASR